VWHFAFNRLAEVNDQLVIGREVLRLGGPPLVRGSGIDRGK
jgi:hypothetical protein